MNTVCNLKNQRTQETFPDLLSFLTDANFFFYRFLPCLVTRSQFLLSDCAFSPMDYINVTNSRQEQKPPCFGTTETLPANSW